MGCGGSMTQPVIDLEAASRPTSGLLFFLSGIYAAIVYTLLPKYMI